MTILEVLNNQKHMLTQLLQQETESFAFDATLTLRFLQRNQLKLTTASAMVNDDVNNAIVVNPIGIESKNGSGLLNVSGQSIAWQYRHKKTLKANSCKNTHPQLYELFCCSGMEEECMIMLLICVFATHDNFPLNEAERIRRKIYFAARAL